MDIKVKHKIGLESSTHMKNFAMGGNRFLETATSGYYTRFTFRDAEWVPSRGDFTFAFANGSKPHINICMTTTNGTAVPGLVLDNARLDLRDSANDGNYMYMFSRLGFTSGTVNYFTSSPYIAVTNGSYLCANLNVTPQCATALDIDIADSSVFLVQYSFIHRWTKVNVDVRGNSRFLVGNQFATVFGMEIKDVVNINLDNSVFARTEDLAAAKIDNNMYGWLTFNVRNGSRIYLDEIHSNAQGQSGKHQTEFNFDDGEWNPQRDEYVFAYENNAPVVIRVLAGGMRLNPPVAGKTWRLATPVSGVGGIVKGGAGELYIDTQEYYGPGTWTYTAPTYSTTNRTGAAVYQCDGTLRVEAGILRAATGALKSGTAVSLSDGTVFDLDGGRHANLVLSGLGTLRNGAVDVLKICVDPSVADGLCIDGSASLDGSVCVDFGAADGEPISCGRHVVATYSGSAPDVGDWRAVNLGDRNLLAEFSAVDGNVIAKVRRTGFCVILR